MPITGQWFQKVPEIIHELEVLTAPVVDRSIIEKLFSVKRRQAIDLCHRFGGFQAGRTFLVDRVHLIAKLKWLQNSSEFTFEQQRQGRLRDMVQEARRLRAGAEVRLPVRPNALNCRVIDLPPGIHMEAGRLTVDFEKPEELLGKLFELAKAAQNDYESFCIVTEKNGANK